MYYEVDNLQIYMQTLSCVHAGQMGLSIGFPRRCVDIDFYDPHPVIYVMDPSFFFNVTNYL